MIDRIIGSVLIRTDEAILENEQKYIYAIADILYNNYFLRMTGLKWHFCYSLYIKNVEFKYLLHFVLMLE